jgi:flagellar M-ring protein FliF
MLDGNSGDGVFPTWSPPDDTSLIEDLTSTAQRSPQKRLEQIVEYDEAKAAAVLRQWMHQGERA